MTGRVYVNPRGNSRGVPKDIRQAIDPRIEIVLVADPRMWVERGMTDFYVTRTNLNADTEQAAAEIGATVVNMPEAAQWLAAKVKDITATGRCVWIFQAGKRGDRP